MILSFSQYILESSGHTAGTDVSKWEGWLANLVQWAGGTLNIARDHDDEQITINIQLGKDNHSIIIDRKIGLIRHNGYFIRALDPNRKAGQVEPFVVVYVTMAAIIMGSGNYISSDKIKMAEDYGIFDRLNQKLESIYWEGEPEELIRLFMEMDTRLQEKGAAQLDRELLTVLMQPLGLSPEEVSDYEILIDLGLL